VMVGNEDQLAVAWLKPQGTTDWPTGLWLARSTDGGKTFSTPAQIGEAWGVISTASRDNTYYIVYRRGTEQKQELALLTSIDNGATWNATSISGARPLYFDWDKAPGVDISPTGTLDVVFYAHGESAPACIEEWAERSPNTRRELGWVDPCTYDVLYTFSQDGGKNFSSAIKLNDQPIWGQRFTRSQGYSKPGEYIGMASATDYAYPIWIDTQGDEGTQASTVQIKR
jgi:hypothetical protein